MWIEFEQGDPDYPIWTGGFWGTAAEVPALALAGNPASPSIVLQTTAAEQHRDQRPAGPDRRDHAQEHDRGDDHGQRHRHHIQNGKGATIVLTGPSVTINNGALVVV